ncbi:hypothetical protein LTS10_010690 [Elasticomyces elasticus]|nr:hypothetical protein LTS10_010690 [Elasticomyces elasticus]
MAEKDQPPNFLDLAPELRVRIYQYYSEPEHKIPQELDILRIRTHAPKVAILRVSRLIRHEALPIGAPVLRQLFEKQRNFVVNLEHKFALRHTQSPEFRAAVSALPRYPISALKLKFPADSRGRVYCWCVGIVRRPVDNRLFRVVHLAELDGRRCDKCEIYGLQETTDALGLALTQQDAGQYLDFGNVVETVFYRTCGPTSS